jgi:hypothetical protein
LAAFPWIVVTRKRCYSEVSVSIAELRSFKYLVELVVLVVEDDESLIAMNVLLAVLEVVGKGDNPFTYRKSATVAIWTRCFEGTYHSPASRRGFSQ